MKLQAKLILLLVPVGLAGGLGIALFAQRSVHRIVVDQVKERALTGWEDLLPGVSAGLETRDERQILPLLQEKKLRMDALYLFALDIHGRVVAHTNVVEKGKIYGDPATLRAAALERPGFSFLEDEKGPVLDISIPVWRTNRAAAGENFLLSGRDEARTVRLGTLRMGLPLRTALETESQILQQLYAIVLVFGLLVLATAAFFLKRMTRPIELLSQATAGVARGDYRVRLPVKSRDELGRLSAGFNAMAGALSKAIQKRDETLALLDTFLATAPIGLAFVDRDFRYVRANSSIADMQGVALERHIGRTVEEVIPDLWPRIRTHYESVRDTGRPVLDLEVRGENPREPGDYRIWLVSYYPVRADGGSVMGVGVVVVDITEKKRAEEELTFQADILRKVHDSVVATDLEGRITYWNEGARAIFGYTAEEMLGETPSVLYPDISEQELRKDLEAILAGKDYIGEWKGRRKDGSIVYVSIKTTPMRNAANEVIGFVGVGSDITDRIKAMEEIKALNTGLERRVEERTAALVGLNAELEKARDQALASARIKSQFLANMSHEIRTPLNAVIGMTDLLLGTALAPGQRDFAETAKSSAQSLLAIVNDILDISKIEAGKLRLEEQSFDLQALLEESLNAFLPEAEKRGLRFRRAVKGGLPAAVKGDAGRLRQVLTNLVGNAIKFTERGEVNVEVETVEEAPAHVLVRIAVTDTGIGLSPEAQAALFQPFTQADASTTRKYGGTGLGLAISKQLIDLLGGSIGVESRLGQGSTFWVQIPLAKAPAGAARPPAPASPAPEIRWDPGRLTVLVAEDNPVNRKVVQSQLQHLGVRSETAPNGKEAVSACRRAAYDLILMDCQMPEMDGYTATAEIRRWESSSADGRPKRTPIIAMTAYAMEGDRERCLAAGMDDYVAKPIHLEDLKAILSRWSGARAV